MIDLDILLADFRSGETVLTQRLGQGHAAGDDVAAMTGSPALTANVSRRRAASASGCLETRKLDRRKTILLAGVGGQDDAKLAPGILGPRFDIGVVITLASKELAQEIGVGACTAPDLRGVGGIFALGLQRGLLAKRLKQILGPADRAEALDQDGITDIAGGGVGLNSTDGLRRGRWRRRGWRRRVLALQFGPGHTEIEQRVERRARVELGRIGRRCRRDLGHRQRRHGDGRCRRARKPRGKSPGTPPAHQAASLTSASERRQYVRQRFPKLSGRCR